MKPFQWIIYTYNVPAALGRKIIINGKPGIITADRGNYIGVTFDSDKPGTISNAHPTWKTEYGEMGKIRPMTRSQKRYNLYLKGEYNETFGEFLKNGWYTQ